MIKTLFFCTLGMLAGWLIVGPWYYDKSPLHNSVTKAVAMIYPTQNQKVTGVVTFNATQQGIKVALELQGLTPGKHGFHIHEHGNCNCPDANCAGGHYNPTNMPHASPVMTHRHVGDFGNIEADKDGVVRTEFLDTHITLNGPHSIIGRSVIVHEKEDDFITQPSGNAGARWGCGVIGIAA